MFLAGARLVILMGYLAMVAADPAAQVTLAATADTLAATALVTNDAGKFLGFFVFLLSLGVALLRPGRSGRGS